MDTTPKLNRAELMQELRADFEELLTKLADALLRGWFFSASDLGSLRYNQVSCWCVYSGPP